jgi:hypothetical protein
LYYYLPDISTTPTTTPTPFVFYRNFLKGGGKIVSYR